MIAAVPATVDRIPAGPFGQSCYVLSAGRDAVVVDPGGEAELIVEHIAVRRLHVRAVLATHGHYDHVSALPDVVDACGAPFGIHSADERVLTRVNLSRWALHRHMPVELPPVGIDLADVNSLRFGALELSVLHTPGHTPGSVCLDAGGALLTGDTLLADGVGRSDTREADRASLESSVRDLARLYPPDTAIHPGHGGPGRLGAALAAGYAPGAEP